MDYDLLRDAYGNVTNAADAAGNAWTYVHDANSVPRGETWGMAGGTPSVASTTNELFRSVDAFRRPTGYALAVDGVGKGGVGYSYDDFGRAISQSGSLADVFHHRFSTKYFDVETGLYYYGYRFYSPFLYRWLSRDPVMEDGGNNLYSFVFNSPMDLTDSLGLKISISETPLSVSDNIRSNARAYFIRYSDVTMSCTGLGVLNINGNAGRHIHIVTPDQNVWNVRYSRYDSKWGKDRSNTDEWKATLSHERDHWHSFDAFFSFLRFLNECDGEKLCRQCESMKESLQTQYNVLWSKAINKSTSYDTRGKNSGGVYPR